MPKRKIPVDHRNYHRYKKTISNANNGLGQMTIRCKVSYFGYSVQFDTNAATTAERRTEANSLIIARYGIAPKLSYVEPRLPFPDYVPVETYGLCGDGTGKEFYDFA